MELSKKALVTGATGQDASYLMELLLSKEYEVHATIRRNTSLQLNNIQHLLDKITLHSATLENYGSLYKVVEDVFPDECYHLAAQSFVANSFDDEFSTMNTNINGTHYMLNAVKEINPDCKFYFAGTSEMFGNQPAPQNEKSLMKPVSPYGISKLAGFNLCRYYREAFNMFIACGILFNHESPRRGNEFVTKKICNAAKKKEKVKLGNLEAKRDWGYAGDYVDAMYRMLQAKLPDDYVIATGETHSVREFAESAYATAGLDYRDFVESDPKFLRLNELRTLRGDAVKANINLEWYPKVTFTQLVEKMMKDDR